MIGIAEVAALITVVGAAIYGLGLLGVAWPIHKRWQNDAATTLYAVSLIPRAVVAGQGIRILMGFPTLVATLLLVWSLLVAEEHVPPGLSMAAWTHAGPSQIQVADLDHDSDCSAHILRRGPPGCRC